jgi:hypothetical protein
LLLLYVHRTWDDLWCKILKLNCHDASIRSITAAWGERVTPRASGSLAWLGSPAPRPTSPGDCGARPSGLAQPSGLPRGRLS